MHPTPAEEPQRPLGSHGAGHQGREHVAQERDPGQTDDLLRDDPRQHVCAENESIEDRCDPEHERRDPARNTREEPRRDADGGGREEHTRRQDGGSGHRISVLPRSGPKSVSETSAPSGQSHSGQRRGGDALRAVVDDVTESGSRVLPVLAGGDDLVV